MVKESVKKDQNQEQFEPKKLKVFLLSNVLNSNQQCNVQVNRKTFQNLLRSGDVLEITPTVSQSANLQTINNSVSINHLSSSFGTNIGSNNQNDDHSYSPILLQIVDESFKDDVPLDTIRIDSAAGLEPFNINKMSYVMVRRVDKKNIQLDLVELIFKDQYFNGSDMWRLKKQLENKCIYVKKNIEFCGMRYNVREMWMSGEIVSCGYVSEDTRLVFRSQSAMCSIYIQMSSEMWEFDVNGEMYHEKAINFLAELFANWKNQTCQHDVTITLFSRVFYEAESIDEFPPVTNECLKQDHKNRFFEDFYRVIYQNERNEDWMFSLVRLKRLIKEYRDYILNYHERQTTQKVPKAYLSNAAEGNFLETINLSSCVFERHFVDRPFDRTGMMSVVITGGRGVFEVNHELSKITKERVIYNGIGSDLVCLGEQPLHQVPLFKYAGTDTYSIPHWINLSFYKSSEIIRFCNSKFIPRIKVKFNNNDNNNSGIKTCMLDPKSILPGYDPNENTLEESDEILIKPKTTDSLKRAPSRIATINEHGMLGGISSTSNSTNNINNNNNNNNSNGKLCKVDDECYDSSLETDSDPETSATSTTSLNSSSHYKKKINPFSPSTIKTRMSFDRRRWAHLFPLKPDGTPIFQHWVNVKSVNLTNPEENNISINENTTTFSGSKSDEFKKYTTFSKGFQQQQTKRRAHGSIPSLQNNDKSKFTIGVNRINEINDIGGDESIATMITGVAWKSLTIPACLPLTTDYYPSDKSWEQRFHLIGEYCLILDEIRDEHNYVKTINKRITMKNVVPELVGHRLAMGFQLVKPVEDKRIRTKIVHPQKIIEKFMLSFGRIYHELFYIIDEENEKNDLVKVEIYAPNSESKLESILEHKYVYRFQVPDSKVYHVSYCDLSRKDIKLAKWNSIDRYICMQGNGDISPLELQNCWRQRLYLLPIFYFNCNSITNNNNNINFNNNQPNNSQISAVVLTQNIQAFVPVQTSSVTSIMESPVHFDVYQRKPIDELKSYREFYFIRFMEILNKVTRSSENNRIHLNSMQKNKLLLPSPNDKLNALIEEFNLNKLNKNKFDEIFTYLEKTYAKAMIDSIPFLGNKNDIPPNTFISAEATWWCIQNVNDINNETQAIQFLQIFLDFDLIRHISNVEYNKSAYKEYEKQYVHGFYLYYILTNESRKFEFVYTKDYCEVGLCDFDCGVLLDEKNIFFSKNLPKQSKLLPVSGAEYTYSRFGLNLTLEPQLKIVNVDVDPNNKSSRVEWASALYRSYYHPLAAFELEIYWKMATGQLLSDLINQWSKMSLKVNYHMVPGPIDPFTSPIDQFGDPLRGCLYIKLNLKSLLQDEQILFENYIEKKYFKYDNDKFIVDSDDLFNKYGNEFKEFFYLRKKDEHNFEKQLFFEQYFQEYLERERTFRLQYFQEAILERFGFIRNAAITKQHNSDDDATFFIHSSGGMFILIPNYYANYTGRSRHASAVNQNNIKQNTQQKQQQQQQQKKQQSIISDVDLIDSKLNSNKSLNNINNNNNSDDIQIDKQTTLFKPINKIENSKSFENVTRSLNFIDSDDGFSKSDENKENLQDNKLSFSQDSLLNTNENAIKVLENHVFFNNKISSHNYNPNQATNSYSTTTTTTATGPTTQRARSNTKSQNQFYELNKGTINNYYTSSTTSSSSTQQLNSSSVCSSIASSHNNKNFNDNLFINSEISLDLVDSINKNINFNEQQQQKIIKNEFILQQQTSFNSNNNSYLNQQQTVLFNNQDIWIDNLYCIKKRQPFYLDNDIFIGFLWSWNFMLGKRWRSHLTGDELFQDCLLADFRAFCSNKDDRLVKFFNDSKP